MKMSDVLWTSYRSETFGDTWYVGYIDQYHIFITRDTNKPGTGKHIAQIADWLDAGQIKTAFETLKVREEKR